MKYFIITGEASGDLHGSKLAESLSGIDGNAVIKGIGAENMEKSGVEIVKSSHEINIMGFWEVLKKLNRIRIFLRSVKVEILNFQPNALILIDFGGFNLRIAKWAKKNNIKVFYYISPKLWAWNSGRARQIKQNVFRMYVIFPFEVEFYKKYGVNALYVGNPILDRIGRDDSNKIKQNYILLLPGSREQEIKFILPNMLQALKNFNTEKFIIAKAANVKKEWIDEAIKNFAPNYIKTNISVVNNQTYDLLKNAKAALVTSGTATLETALHYTPQIVCYIANPISYHIAKRVINTKYISLVNLILNKPLVPELIQDAANPESISEHLSELLKPENLAIQKEGYDELWSLIGTPGAAHTTANDIYNQLCLVE